ncbi:MAG TPA: TlpA disulfide reductase family protein [Bacteroidota bacterium]|nr:TlpA disulfide reductase family protein [Bacteroidota bacterium]
MKRILTTLCLALLLLGCQKPAPPQALWAGHIHRSDGKAIPFRAYVDLQAQPPSGYFLVGDERTPVPEISRSGDSLTFLFSEYNAAMRGVLHGTTWEGNYIRYRTSTMSIPFTATAEAHKTAPTTGGAKPAIPLVGKFRAIVGDDKTADSSALGTFWMRKDSIFGTLIEPDGDYGLNAGTQSGTVATLSRFTGWQAQLLELTQDGSSWKGTIAYRDDKPTTIVLQPRPTHAVTPEGGRKTKIKDTHKPFWFSGITASGDTLSSTSSRFKGKALIVDVMGTWCHNCMDEAPVLQQVYADFRDKGLEVVGLSFEINDNAEQARKNLTLYGQRYGITFPLLFCGSTDDKYVAPQLRSQLMDFYAYPTALFIDKAGHVREIHIGFRGPGTGEEFQAEINQVYYEVRRITGS